MDLDDAAENVSPDTLIEERFTRLLELMAELGLYRSTPKFFIIYAHDNEQLREYKAHERIVKDFISWFKKLCLDIHSDKSPHGLLPGRGPEISGASNDILMNQLCLLPDNWDSRAVDYVLVFGSRLLGKYVQDEESWNPDNGETFTQKLRASCEALENDLEKLTTTYRGADFRERLKQWWQQVRGKINRIRSEYAAKMDTRFHNVLTELALLRLRAKRDALPRTIPILLCEESEDHESGLGEFINEDPTIRVRVDQRNRYERLFKMLTMFEELEDDRLLIDAFGDCFKKCVTLLNDRGGKNPARCRHDCELITLQTLRQLTDSPRYKTMGRNITNIAIRKVLNLHSLLEASSIKRISGESLPGDLNDVDLAVARKVAVGDGNQNEPSNLEKQTERQLVALHDLFEKRKLASGLERTPNRILIRGLPGIGKSTLSRRIMYEYSCNKALRHKYHFVIRLPLRKLELTRDLEQLLFAEFFKLIPRGHKFATKLSNLILKQEHDDRISEQEHDDETLKQQGHHDMDRPIKADKILFILDGLDETQGWPEEKIKLLEKLINQPTVIILSRFGVSGTTAINSIDIEMEAIGLSNENIWAYIDNRGIVTTEDAADIRRFIARNQTVREMILVPIHLDILCYSWDELMRQRDYSPSNTKGSKREQPPTITQFYQAVTSKLWRKDIPRLEKLDNGHAMTEEVINAVRDVERLERPVRAEIDLLGKIAINLMDKGLVEFLDADVDEAIRELEKEHDALLPLTLENNIRRLSFLRMDSNRSSRHSYSFVHLTFQEFFAAKYLTHNSARMEEHLRKHKYNRRYEGLWRFVAGLLSTKTQLDAFFDLLEQEPRDLVGTPHAHLIMQCLSECQSRLDPARRKSLHKALSEWLGLELELRLPRTIGSAMAFPEDILLERLVSPHGELQASHFESIFLQPTLSEGLCDQLVNLFEHNPYGNAHISKLLSNQLSLYPNILRRLLPMWGSKNLPKMELAAEILGQHDELPESRILDLIDTLKLDIETWRTWAFTLLKSQRHLPTAAIERLLELLTQGCRHQAAELLMRQSKLPREAIDRLIDGSIQSQDTRNSYLQVLIRQLHLETESLERLHNHLMGMNDRSLKIRIVSELVKQPTLRNVLLPLLQEAIESASSSNPFNVIDIRQAAMAIADIRSELPRGVCLAFAHLLGHDDKDLRRHADIALSRQKNWIDDEVVLVLKQAFKRYPLDVASVNGVRLSLFVDDPIHWVIKQASRVRGTPNAPGNMWKYSHLLYTLLWDENGPSFDDNCTWWQEVESMLLDSDENTWFGIVLRHKASLKPETLIKLVDKLGHRPRMDVEDALRGRPEAAEMMVGLLERRGDCSGAVTQVLRSYGSRWPLLDPLPSESLIQRLAKLVQDSTRSRSTRDAAAQILVSQPRLSSASIHALLEYTESNSSSELSKNNRWWSLRTSEELCSVAAESSDRLTVARLLKRAFLTRPIEEATVAWISRDSLHWYGPDGSQMSRELKEEKVFRDKFQQAQRIVGIPQWAVIQPDLGRDRRKLGILLGIPPFIVRVCERLLGGLQAMG